MIEVAERQDYHVLGGDAFRKHHEHISSLIDMFDATREKVRTAFQAGLQNIRVVRFDAADELVTDRGEKLAGHGIDLEDARAGFADADAGRIRPLADVLKDKCK